jgi:siroheme synthase
MRAPVWKIRVWLTRQGVDPDWVTSLIHETATSQSERWEMTVRWNHQPDAAIDDPLVVTLWGHVHTWIPRPLTIDEAWEEILAI